MKMTRLLLLFLLMLVLVVSWVKNARTLLFNNNEAVVQARLGSNSKEKNKRRKKLKNIFQYKVALTAFL